MREAVMKNRRAAYALEHATPESEWLSASWERFGRQRPNPAKGLLAIGDSAAFIDPFTGSGMLMAFESGELVAETIISHRDNLTSEALGHKYTKTTPENSTHVCGFADCYDALLSNHVWPGWASLSSAPASSYEVKSLARRVHPNAS